MCPGYAGLMPFMVLLVFLLAAAYLVWRKNRWWWTCFLAGALLASFIRLQLWCPEGLNALRCDNRTCLCIPELEHGRMFGDEYWYPKGIDTPGARDTNQV